MKRDQAIHRRFEHLAREAERISATKQTINEGYGPEVRIDNDAYIQWKTNASHLLAMVCGESSQHFLRFIKAETVSMVRGYHDCLIDGAAIFRAAKDDYENGLFNSLRNLIQ